MPGKSVNGPVHAVPCPHCAAANDFRDLLEHLQNQGLDDEGVETGAEVVCDHCKRTMVVAQVKTVTFVAVRIP